MKHTQKIILFSLFSFLQIHSVSLVYNLKIRRIFNVPFVLKRMKSKWPLSIVPLFFTRSRENLLNIKTDLRAQEKRHAGGAVLNARYVHDKHWWAEITSAIAKDSGTFSGDDGFCGSRAGLDDIVLSGGYRHFMGDRAQFIAYGLAGLPTRRKLTESDRHGALLGTRLFSVGAGAEASYSFINDLKQSLSAIVQFRFLHGFNRSYEPVLPKGGIIQPGNGYDLFFIMQYRERKTVFEMGYNATIFSKQAIVLPKTKIESDTFVRHSGFVSVSHAFFNGFFGKRPLIVGAGFNTNGTHVFNAHSLTTWVNFTVVF